jgi:hypothetical protein
MPKAALALVALLAVAGCRARLPVDPAPEGDLVPRGARPVEGTPATVGVHAATRSPLESLDAPFTVTGEVPLAGGRTLTLDRLRDVVAVDPRQAGGPRLPFRLEAARCHPGEHVPAR